MDNILNARIKLKYDNLTNWNNSTFTPLAGEVCIAYIETNSSIHGGAEGTQLHQPRAIGIKVGDGTNTFANLPWAQAVAADVYNWAKASTKPNYNATEISSTRSDVINGNTVTSTPTVEAWLQALTDDISGLSGNAGNVSSQIANALNALDVTNVGSDPHNITGFGTDKTLATLIEDNGYISATFQDILIAQDHVTGLEGALAAKAPLNSPALTGTPTAPTATAGTNSTQVATTAFVKNAIDAATAGLTGAMHFIGITSTEITDGATTNTLVAKSTGSLSKTTGFENGDVVLYDNDITIGKEFVWTGSAWELLGDEGSYAFNTITVTGTNGLTGGGNLQTDRTIEHAVPTGASAGTLGSPTDNGGRKYIQTLTTDTYGHVTGATYAAETVTDTTYTFAEGSTNGAFSVTPSDGNAQSVPIHGLENIATNATAYNLDEVNISHSQNVTINNVTHTGSNNEKYFVLDCGDAFKFVDNDDDTPNT